MKAAILKETGKMVIQDIPDATPGPDDILIKTRYAGVCGSDLHTYQGHHPFRKPPVILGHEISGNVVGFGKNVTGFNEGDAVTVMPVSSCGVCRQCLKDKPNLCLKREMPGMNDWHGTFAEYFISKPDITYKISEHIDLKTGILAEPLAVGIHSVRQANIGKNSNTLILGGGSIGILTAAAARIDGAENIIITDLYESNLAAAEKLTGATTYMAGASDLVSQIKTDHPDGFDTVFLCSSEKSTVNQAITLADSGAKIVVTGWFTDPLSLNLTDITLNEIEIIGSLAYNPDDFRTALACLDSGRIPLGEIVSHVFPLGEADTAMKCLINREDNPLKILLNFEE